MARNFRKSKFRGRIGNPVKPSSTTVLPSGLVDNQTNAKQTHILQAHRKFSKKQIASKTNSTEPVELAASVLAALGCSILDLPINYSLLETQTDQEILLNAEISNLRIADLKPVAIDATTNMGTNTADPFWNLDPGPSLASKNLKTGPKPKLKQMDATQITAELVNYNMSPNTSTLKEFK